MPLQKVVIIAGPTAIGKTALLSKIQERIQPGIEVINCDSVQVFRELNIASAKPSDAVLRKVPHHLIDILHPREKFTAGSFVRHSEQLIAEIVARQKIPVIAGGTIFYLKSFLYGLPQIPQITGNFRAELEQLSPKALQDKLQELDPTNTIHPNDRQRRIRACEVSLETRRPFSAYKAPSKPRRDYQVLTIVLERPRLELYQRINERVQEMFASGLLDELKELDDSAQGIGYREFFLAKPQDRNQEYLLPIIQQNSRNYAKRQITFLKKLPEANFHHPEDIEVIAAKIIQFYCNKKSTS